MLMAVFESPVYKAGQGFEVVRAEDDVKMLELLRQFFPIALPYASAYGDDSLVERASGPQRNVFHRSDLAVEPCVCSFANAACHEYDDIGFLKRCNLLHSSMLEHAANAFRIMLVHLAAKRLDEETKVSAGNGVAHSWGSAASIGCDSGIVFDDKR